MKADFEKQLYELKETHDREKGELLAQIEAMKREGTTFAAHRSEVKQ
jgi:hypothetical protein